MLRENRLYFNLVTLFAVVSGLISVTVLANWIGRTLHLFEGILFFLDMAPSTAFLSLLLSCLIIRQNLQPKSSVYYKTILIAIGVSLCYSLSVIIAYAVGWFSHPEAWIVQNHIGPGGNYIGVMAPPTAAVFVLLLAAYGLEFVNTTKRTLYKQIAVMIAIPGFVATLLVILGYLVGFDMMPNAMRIPMGILTSIGLFFLSQSIILNAGSLVFPLSLIYHNPGKDNLANRKFKIGTFVTFVTLCLAIGLISIIFLKEEMKGAKNNVKMQLSGIADSKATLLSSWLEERSANTQLIVDSGIINSLIIRTMHHRSREDSRDLISWMHSMEKNYQFETIAILDTMGVIVLGSHQSLRFGRVDSLVAFRQALATKNIVNEDISSDNVTNPDKQKALRLRIWIPICSDNLSGNNVVACLLIQINPYLSMLPMLQSWPAFSKSAETILIRMDGDKVHYLNDLRFKTKSALMQKYELSQHPDKISAAALQGVQGLVESKDYRGIQVVGVIKKINGHPWYIIAKIDQEEIYSSLRARVWAISITTLILIFVAALVVGMLSRKRNYADYLRISNEWRTTFDAVNDAILLINLDQKIIRANKSIESLLGVKAEDAIGKQCWSVVHKDSQPGKLCPLSFIQETKQRAVYELESGDKWLQISVDPYYDEANELFGSVHIIQDITARKASMQTIIESEEKFRAIFDQSPTGVAIVSNDRKFLKVNASLQTFLGYTEEELSHLTVNDITHPDFQESDNVSVRQLMNGEVLLYNHDKKYITKGGEEIWGHVTASLITGAEGKPLFLLATVENIQERIEADLRLKESEEKFRNIFEHSTIGKAIAFPDGTIHPNEALCKLLGYNEAELNAQWLALEHPDDAGGMRAYIDELLSGSVDSARLTKRFIRRDGQIVWVDISIRIQRDDSNNIQFFISSLIDITAEKQALDELVAAKEKAELSDRLKTGFLQNMSHEIRTPMNGILGFSSLLEKESPSLEDIKKYAGYIRTSGYRMMDLINNILDISRIEAGEIEIHSDEIRINKLMADLYHLSKPLSDAKGLELSYYIPPEFGEARIYADEMKITQIMTNLINNAIKFTASGKVDFRFSIQDNSLIMTVEDTGCGIPDEHKERIFDRFYQADMSIGRGFEGAGLGLSICKGLVDAMRGELSFETDESKGTVFTVKIPVVVDNTTILVPPVAQPAISVKRLHVLVAEDEIISYMYLERILHDLDMIVTRAVNGQEAVDMIKAGEHFDLVLMDIRMPVMNGLEATRLIKALRPLLPVIAQTAYAYEAEKAVVMSQGCDDYLTKPIDQSSLLASIKKFI